MFACPKKASSVLAFGRAEDAFLLTIAYLSGHDPHYFLTGVGFGGDNDRRSNIILSILTPFGYTLKTPITARTAGRSDRTERRT